MDTCARSTETPTCRHCCRQTSPLPISSKGTRVRANLIAALTGMLCVVGCGGGGIGGTTNSSEPNVQAVTVDSGPSGIAGTSNPAVNTLYTTITICVPGTSTCQQIDHIQVDTGSSGLRIISTVLTLSLPL